MHWNHLAEACELLLVLPFCHHPNTRKLRIHPRYRVEIKDGLLKVKVKTQETANATQNKPRPLLCATPSEGNFAC